METPKNQVPMLWQKSNVLHLNRFITYLILTIFLIEHKYMVKTI